MSVPRLFLGEDGGNRLLRADDGFQDGTAAIALRVESVPAAPAGPGGEAIFPALYLVCTATMAVTISVTPIVDGVELETQQITLSAETERTTTQHELGLSVPNMDGAVEKGRNAARGTWFSVRVAVTALAAGDLIIDGVALEYEVVRESLPATGVVV